MLYVHSDPARWPHNQRRAFAAMPRVLVLAGLLFASAGPVAAQSAPQASSSVKQVITQDEYDTWRSIQGATLSRDGHWAAYTLTPQVGEGDLVAHSTTGAAEHRVARGFTGRPQLQAGASSGFSAPPARFTADSRHLVFTILPSQADVERARREKQRPARQPKPSLGILRLEDGNVTRMPQVKSFELSKDAGRFVAYHREAEGASAADTAAAGISPPAAPAAVAAAPGGEPRPIAGDSAAGAKTKKETGSPLVLHDLSTGAETVFENVTSYAMDDTGRWLAFTVASKPGDTDGVYVRSLNEGRTHAVLTGEGNYKQLAFDEAGSQLAFVSDRDTHTQDKPRYALYHAPLRSPTARPLVTPAALQDGWIVSDRGNVSFTRKGNAVLFGIAPAPLDSIPADSLADKVVFDRLHYQDQRLQPQQSVEAARDRNRAYTAAYQLGARRMVRLANDTFPSVTVSDDGRTALALSNVPYAVEAMWGEGGSDVWVIDATTGRRTRVAERVRFGASLSPGGDYVLYFHDGRWHAYEVASRRTVDLTGPLAGVKFDQETWSTPSTPAPWGVAGWMRGDRSVLLYDRYDVWEIDPRGRRQAQVVTDSAGRHGQMVFRVVDLDREERFLDPSRPLLFSVFDEVTKVSGFAEGRAGTRARPGIIVLDSVNFGTPSRAKDASTLLVTRSTFRDFPNLWTGERLNALHRISDANPQQSDYRWGDVELVKWLSADGAPLEGLLYRPEGFDPAKRYPMVVYFYERHGDNLHNYVAPAGRNVVNPTVYTSLGYLVFMPDIAYSEGYPGPSAVKSIVPGVQALIGRGFVDPQAVGIAGQSWGGYQTAYIVTQTNLFAAAVANAPVANMTSAYGGIRWQTGLARAFQYERTQSRIGGSLWEYPMRYLENSPLFQADRVETPLLMMHNDADGAVPWYQGIEMFVALRRLGSEAYLINYNCDAHNPTKRANQKDIDLRMQQFFDHHLRGEPAPEWMRSGIPFLQKGRDQLAQPSVAEQELQPVEPGG
ncbi:prolyl oligopeptidase family serine peptidase [soil metagenome]